MFRFRHGAGLVVIAIAMAILVLPVLAAVGDEWSASASDSGDFGDLGVYAAEASLDVTFVQTEPDGDGVITGSASSIFDNQVGDDIDEYAEALNCVNMYCEYNEFTNSITWYDTPGSAEYVQYGPGVRGDAYVESDHSVWAESWSGEALGGWSTDLTADAR